jgi:predicted nucleotidyltransferase
MPSYERNNNRRSADLGALLDGLMASGVEFILVGGLAAVAQGSPITTLDVDIVHHQTDENIHKLLTFLLSVGARHRRPDDKVIKPNKRDLLGPGHALFVTQLGPLDVLGVIEEGRGYDALLEDTEEIDFRGRRMRVLKLETLVALKRHSEDLKDRHRLPLFEEVLRQIRSADAKTGKEDADKREKNTKA